MICYKIKDENKLGRSLVIDLEAPADNNIRQVDHRSIDYIIFKNVKYTLSKSKKKGSGNDDEDEEEKKAGGAGKKKWDSKKLTVGNWFSSTLYYKVKNINKDEVEMSQQGKPLTISRDILEYEMNSGKVFAKTEKLPLTKVVKQFMNASGTVFTVSFRTKLNDKTVKEKLQTLDNATLKDAKRLKDYARDLIQGEEMTITGRYYKHETKLGRSLIIDLD